MSQSDKPELHLDEKWDRVINVVFSRSTMGLMAGTVAGFLLFRGGQARTATAMFGLGTGVGSAYQSCDQEFKELFLPKPDAPGP